VPYRYGSEVRRYLPDLVPAVNNLRTLGRWAFAELTEIYQIESDFEAKVAREFDRMLAEAAGASAKVFA
jgi:type III restriction enzyme